MYRRAGCCQSEGIGQGVEQVNVTRAVASRWRDRGGAAWQLASIWEQHWRRRIIKTRSCAACSNLDLKRNAGDGVWRAGWAQVAWRLHAGSGAQQARAAIGHAAAAAGRAHCASRACGRRFASLPHPITSISNMAGGVRVNAGKNRRRRRGRALWYISCCEPFPTMFAAADVGGVWLTK